MAPSTKSHCRCICPPDVTPLLSPLAVNPVGVSRDVGVVVVVVVIGVVVVVVVVGVVVVVVVVVVVDVVVVVGVMMAGRVVMPERV